MENKSRNNLINVLIYSAIILGFAFFLVKAIISNSEFMAFQIMAAVAIIGWYSFKVSNEVRILRSKNDIEKTA